MAKRSMPLSWFAMPNVPGKWVVLAVCLWAIALLALHRTDVGGYLEARIGEPLGFHVREALGKSPVLSEKLKIYAIDDSTYTYMGHWVLPIDVWAQVFRSIALKKPRAILVDAIFSHIEDPDGVLAAAIGEIKGLDVPIIVGSFFTPSPIRFREPFDFKKDNYLLAKMQGSAAGGEVQRDQLPPLWEPSSINVYGPDPRLEQVFSHVGHMLYPGEGRIAALVRLGPDHAMPHLALYLARQWRMESRKLILDVT